MRQDRWKIPTRYRRRADAIPTAAITLCALAAPAAALEVPSGQPVELQEVLVDPVEGGNWLRFRFVAPDIARDGAGVPFEQAEPDMLHLCETLAIPYIADYALEGEIVVISFADRATEFGTADPDATQFFEMYRLQDGTCVWEGL